MQKELDQENMGRPIRILGINEETRASANADMTDGRDLPWLQDTFEADVWHLWVHEHRDVVILDVRNQRVAAFNLSNYPLEIAENYASLKQMFLNAAAE
jgi:hypothetical protein